MKSLSILASNRPMNRRFFRLKYTVAGILLALLPASHTFAMKIEDIDQNFKVQKSTVENGLKWIPASDDVFTVNGLPWFKENEGEFIRLPKRAKELVSPGLWELALMTSGGRVRFKTDSTTLKLRILHTRESLDMHHMSTVGVSGIDLYEGPPQQMIYRKTNKPETGSAPYVSTYFEKGPKKMREFTLYLPVYNGLKSLEIGLDEDAKIEPPTPFRIAKPVVVYGTSITQGGCSTRGATGYVPLAGRMLGIDVVNLGFSGSAKSEPELADLMTEIDASCYVIDSIANTGKGEIPKYPVFVQKVRAKRPDTPILLMTHTLRADETTIDDGRDLMVIRICNEMREKGDKNIYVLDVRELIGREADHPSVDGVHLSDIGFKRLADVFTPKIKAILNLD